MAVNTEENSLARSAKENAAVYTRKIFMWINYILFGMAFASIAALLCIRISPTGWGWLLLTINILTIVAGMAGCMSPSEPRCYTFHMTMTVATALLQGCASLVLFTRTEASLHHLTSSSSGDDGTGLVKLDAALSLFMFCILWIVLALACVIHYCAFADFYEDLEGKKGRSSAKVQEEPLDRVVIIGNESEVAKLNKEMGYQSHRKLSGSEFYNLSL